MTEFTILIPTVCQTLEEGLFLAEGLLFPEVSHLGTKPERLRKVVLDEVRRRIDDVTTEQRLWAHQRWMAGAVEPCSCRFSLEPPLRSAAWTEPVELVFPGLQWRQADDAWVAFLPSLGIEILAASAEELPPSCEQQARMTLRRIKAAASLRSLVFAQRCRSVEIVPMPLTVTWRPLKQTVRQERLAEDAEKSVLEEVATDLTRSDLPPAYELDSIVGRIAQSLTDRSPQSLLLVGPSGVGKTAAVYEVVRRRADVGLGKTPFWGTSGARLVAGMSGFGLWQERCRRLWQECARRKGVLHVGSLFELMQVGKSEAQSQGIAAFLRPYISRGDLLVIAESTPEQLTLIERESPQLRAAFQQIDVPEPDLATGRAILQRVLEATWRGPQPLMQDEALETLDRLHRRYTTYSAWPGRPLRFLRDLRTDHSTADPPLTAPQVTAEFARETGLPAWLLDAGAPFDVPQARQWFRTRVIGQDEAVDTVVDLLVTIKAGLNPVHKPLASLLFIGPTGVGKTELAKSLAGLLFGSPERLVRFDLSEFADELSVQRLIGGTFETEGVLTSRVREQPFSVVLLDEFEKGHPALFDLLLQVLGEGRLTDACGRLADFHNSVIIMTSNLGAEGFRKGTVGFQDALDRTRTRDHFVRAVEQFVRPELFNRIDRVVPFSPLDAEAARQVVLRQFELVRQREGFKYRGVSLDVAASAIETLVQAGFEPAFGARSLKRVIERDVLSPLARQFTAQPFSMRLTAGVTTVEREVSVNVRAEPAGRGTRRAAELSDYELVDQCQRLRLDWQALQRCPAVRRLRDIVYRIEKMERKLLRKRYKTEEELRRLGMSEGLKTLLGRVDGDSGDLLQVEDEALLGLYGHPSRLVPATSGERDADRSGLLDRARLGQVLDTSRAAFESDLLDVHAREFEQPDRIRIGLFGGARRDVARLCAAYCRLSESERATVELWQFTAGTASRDQIAAANWRLETLEWEASPVAAGGDNAELWRLVRRGDVGLQKAIHLQRRKARRWEAFCEESVPEGTLCVLLDIKGPRMFPRLVLEAGLHVFVHANGKHECRVQTGLPPLGTYLPNWELMRRSAAVEGEQRRTYNDVQEFIADPRLGVQAPAGRRNWAEQVASLVREAHVQQARKLLN